MDASFNNIHDFNPENIGDLSGKVILITGGKEQWPYNYRLLTNDFQGNTGLGFQTVKHLAAHKPKIVFTSRSEQKANDAIANIKKDVPDANVSFIQMDLTSLASVQAAAREFVKSHDRLDVLMTNAGIMNVPAALTKDGYELQFGTNHVGHALLIKLLLPTLLKTAEKPGSDVRIVSLSSEGFRGSTGIDFKAEKTPMDSWLPLYGYIRYGASKLANVLYAKQLAQRYPSITAVSIHPGIVKTDLVNGQSFVGRGIIKASTSMLRLKMVEAEQGAFNQTWAATAPKEQLKSGLYYTPVGVVGKPTKAVTQGKVELELWDWTQEELKNWEL